MAWRKPGSNWRYTALIPKKLPWNDGQTRRASKLAWPALHDRLGCPGKAKPDGVLLSLPLPNTGGFPQAPRATRSEEASHAIKWSLARYALPRSGPAAADAGMAREVIEQGRMRSGAGREAPGETFLCSPYKRKAELCPRHFIERKEQ